MKNVAKAFGDIMKPGEYVHLFCMALQYDSF